MKECPACKLSVLELEIDYYDCVIYLFIHFILVLLFVRAEVGIKRYFNVQFLLGTFF